MHFLSESAKVEWKETTQFASLSFFLSNEPLHEATTEVKSKRASYVKKAYTTFFTCTISPTFVSFPPFLLGHTMRLRSHYKRKGWKKRGQGERGGRTPLNCEEEGEGEMSRFSRGEGEEKKMRQQF